MKLTDTLKAVFADITKEIIKNPIVVKNHDNKNNEIQGLVNGMELKIVKGVNTDENIPYYTYNVYTIDGYLLYGIPMNVFGYNDLSVHSDFASKFRSAQNAIFAKENKLKSELVNSFQEYENNILDGVKID